MQELSWDQPGYSEGGFCSWDGRLEQPDLGIPRSFLNLQEGHVHTLALCPQGKIIGGLGKEVTGTASEVNHQVLEEIRLRNIVRVQDSGATVEGREFSKQGGEINSCKSPQVAFQRKKKNLKIPHEE